MLFTASAGKVKAVLSGGLLLFGATACANRDWSDWAKLQTLKENTRTEVQLQKNATNQEDLKIKGSLHAVTEDSITLRLRDGRRRTLDRQDVHRVRIRMPFSKRDLLWSTLAATAGYIGGSYLWGDGHDRITRISLLIGIPATLGTEIAWQIRMRKVYEVVPTPKSQEGNWQVGTTND